MFFDILICYAYKEWNENVAYYEETIDPNKWDAIWVPLWETRTNINVKIVKP